MVRRVGLEVLVRPGREMGGRPHADQDGRGRQTDDHRDRQTFRHFFMIVTLVTIAIFHTGRHVRSLVKNRR
jgi:hypothetical protein